MSDLSLSTVVFRCNQLDLQVFATMGEMNPIVSGGYGGWEVQDRPHRTGVLNWKGRNPFILTLEAWLSEVASDSSIESRYHDLEKMALPSDELTPKRPPVVRLSGPMVPHTDLPWVINDLAWGKTMRSIRTQHRIQQQVTVTLWEFVSSSEITESNTQPGHGNKPKYGIYTVKKGDTLQSISKKLLGTTKRWKEIARLNSIHDPRALTVGQKLRVPRH